MLKKILFYLMVLLYVAAGINHFWHPATYLLIIPPYMPQPVLLNIAAGIAEILLGLLLLFKATRKPAATGIIIMLIFFLPIHIYMIQSRGCMGGSVCVPLWIAWVRLPLQFVLIYWAWWAGKYRQPQ